MKKCLIQIATPANTTHGLGNGYSGPSLWAATETQTACTVTIDDQGNVFVTKTGAFTAALFSDGDSVLISSGSGVQTGVYTGARVSDNQIRLMHHRSQILPYRYQITTTANPANLDTFSLGGTTYRFTTVTAQANDIFIGASASATMLSLQNALGLTGVAAGAGADYFTGTLGAPLFKNGGAAVSLGGGNVSFFVDTRENDWPRIAAPTLTGTWGSIGTVIDHSVLPERGLIRTICADATIRLPANKLDQWSGLGKCNRLTAVAFSGTAPTIQLFNPRYISVAGAASAPVNGQIDPMLAAPAVALTAGLEVSLGDFPTKYGGLLFRIGGTNPVVLLTYD